MKAKGAVRWNLRVIMDRRQIGTAQLAKCMGVSNNIVSTWRKSVYMPQINEKRWVQIVTAINILCEVNGFPGRKIDLWDLIEFCPDELRDFDAFEYQCASGNARKKPASEKKKAADSNDSTSEKEELIVA